jgi:hypothetical protein
MKEYLIDMIIGIIIMAIISMILGCKTMNEPAGSSEPFEYRFKKTKEKDGLKQQKNKNVTVRFDGGKSFDMITIWLRVRELHSSL